MSKLLVSEVPCKQIKKTKTKTTVRVAYCSSPTGPTLLCVPRVLPLLLVRKKGFLLPVLKTIKFRPTEFEFSVC